MRNHVGALALSLPLALGGAGGTLAADAGAAADAAGARCSEATLRGTYLLSYVGFTVRGEDRGPFAIGGQEVYDGRGNVRAVFTSSTNGRIARFSRTTGRYELGPDCTGSVRYSDGSRYDHFVAPDGSQFVFVETTPGTVATGFELRATGRRVGD